MDGELAGGVGVLVCFEMQVAADGVFDQLGAFNVTGGAVADAQLVSAAGREAELVVESGDGGDLGGGDASELADAIEGLGREPVVVIVEGLEDGDGAITAVADAGDDFVDEGEVNVGMGILPMVRTRAGSPCHIVRFAGALAHYLVPMQ